MWTQNDTLFWKQEARRCIVLQIICILGAALGVIFGFWNLGWCFGFMWLWFGVRELRADFFHIMMFLYERAEEEDEV